MEEVLRGIEVAEELIKTCVLMKIETPSTNQVKAISSVLKGKTIHYVGSPDNRLTWISFVIPILHLIFKLPKEEKTPFICCVICSDYAKSMHICDLFNYLAVGLRIKTQAIANDDNKGEVQNVGKPHILVANLKHLAIYFEKPGAEDFADSVRYLVFHDPEKLEEGQISALNGHLFDALESRKQVLKKKKKKKSRKQEIQTIFFCRESTPKVERLNARFGRTCFERIDHDIEDTVVDGVVDAAAAATAKGSPYVIERIKFFKCSIEGKRDTSKKVQVLIGIINESKGEHVVVFTNSPKKRSALFSVMSPCLKGLGFQVYEKAQDVEDGKYILFCDDKTIFGLQIPTASVYISYDMIPLMDFDHRRYSRAGRIRIEDPTVPVTFVQLVHTSEKFEFQKIVEHLFWGLDQNNRDDFSRRKHKLMERAPDYNKPNSSSEVSLADVTEHLKKLEEAEREDNEKRPNAHEEQREDRKKELARKKAVGEHWTAEPKRRHR